ncbi:glycosyltransferase family A protein [Chryseobacterium sp. TY4]
MHNELITIFTPTYNRAHLLPRLYDSLCRQTVSNFVWLIADDGSKDNTKELVEKWQQEDKINISYYFKENGGMHTGHNLAIPNIKTELCTCIDSDDYLLDNSVETILTVFEKYNLYDNEGIGGIVGLNVSMQSNVIGASFPDYIQYGRYQDVSRKFRAFGDKKVVFKTKYLQELPLYPQFLGEKFVPLYHPIMIDEKRSFLCINENLCVVEYQEDGSTLNIFKQYLKNPQGFRHARGIEMIYYTSLKSKFKSSVHLISSNFILKEFPLKGSPNYLLSLFTLPFGLFWYLYIITRKEKLRDISNYVK